MKDLADQAHELLREQRQSWPTLRENTALLHQAPSRDFDFGQFHVKAQLNLARIGSVSAKVDEHSIKNRQCFLCDPNRPIEQKSLEIGHGYKLLCNPFPILPEHFTLVCKQHRPQLIGQSFGTMLDLAKLLGKRYMTFYNGPQCGASAPDHLHFQAGTKKFLPADREYDSVKRNIFSANHVDMYGCENYLRRFIGLESPDRAAIEAAFAKVFDTFHRLTPAAAEPMINVLCWFDEPVWQTMIFLRRKHRPSFFFADDHSRLLISPGAVDIAGVVVMPRREDYQRVTKEHLAQMYEEVSVSDDFYARLTNLLAAR